MQVSHMIYYLMPSIKNKNNLNKMWITKLSLNLKNKSSELAQQKKIMWEILDYLIQKEAMFKEQIHIFLVLSRISKIKIKEKK